MKRFVSILLLIMMAFALCSLSAALAEHVTESDLIGAWQFVGGGELMGYGFRLNADGTGQWLESEDMEHCPPKHLHETGDGFPGSWTGTASSAGTARAPLPGIRWSRRTSVSSSPRKRPAAFMPASTKRPSGRRSKTAWTAGR